jgi:A/G-specific adenine glycosylase
VWISEIMLQQTQVATVIPYYRRFLKSFPSVQALASADEQTLLSHWEGLGYYRRARSMHAAAQEIVNIHGGKFPDNFADVLALPGIGRYTAGAILSIAQDQRLPILEGNTQRVFSRWISLRSPANETPANRLLWEVAETMLPTQNVGRFNQAAMELGALVCTPKQPDCPQCPIQKHCRAHADGIEEQIPGKVSNVKYEGRTEFAFVISDADANPEEHRRYLVRELPEGGRWAGLWDFPRTTESSLESPESAARELSPRLGTSMVAGEHLTTIRHAVTKYRISLHVHAAQLSHSDAILAPWKYVTLKELTKLPMSVTGRKICKLILAHRDA